MSLLFCKSHAAVSNRILKHCLARTTSSNQQFSKLSPASNPRGSAFISKPITVSKASMPSISSSSAPSGAEAVQPPAPLTKKQPGVATGGIPFPGIPEIADPYQKRQWCLEHMAAAFRVFARLGYNDGAAGHISLRDPVDPNTFWINPLGKHFALLRAKDMVQIDEEGNVIGGNRAAVNAAGFAIHSAIHRARPDVNAACHSHSKYGKAWSAFGKPLDILNQDMCFLYNNQSVYTDFGGVAFAAEEGQRIAEALGPTNRCITLQNHGILTAGSTVDEAAYLFMNMERSCEVQLLVEAATRLERIHVSKEQAEFTYNAIGGPDTLYLIFQTEFEYEVSRSNGEIIAGIPVV